MGWIACSERLPDTQGLYLVIWDNVSSREFPGICSKYDVLFFSNQKWWAPVDDNQPVTHWKPLPDPPQDTKGVSFNVDDHDPENEFDPTGHVFKAPKGENDG